MSGFRLGTWDARGLVGQTVKDVKRAMDETLASAVVLAQTAAPVDTGHMKGTIEMRATQEEGTKLVGRFGNWTAEYTIYVELGTYRMAAQPFLRPAADVEFPLLKERLKR